MAVKAVPTKQLLKEYFNYSVMTSAAVLTGSVAYSMSLDKGVSPSAVFGLVASAWSFPAVVFSLRSLGRLMDITESARRVVPVAIGAYDGPIGEPRVVNGRNVFFNSIPFLGGRGSAFDPTMRDDPDVKSRTIKYREDKPQSVFWDIDVLPRTDRAPVSVRLHQDLVEDIIEKCWRQQERLNHAHPLSQDKMMSLHFSCRGGRRLLLPEYLGFLELGTQFQFIIGRRQGSSGKLGGTPQWCRRRLGLLC